MYINALVASVWKTIRGVTEFILLGGSGEQTRKRTMKLVLITVAVVFFGVGAVHADDAPALLQKYKCYICHADNEPKAGPAYVDVAAAYRGNPKAAATLVALIKKGAHGAAPWHMPPHPEVSDAEARTMARYILSLKN